MVVIDTTDWTEEQWEEIHMATDLERLNVALSFIDS